jgi:TrmH family RNA methyltransferase
MKHRTHIITSRENPGFRHWKKLAHSARERRKAGLILLEGQHLVETWRAIHGLPRVILTNRAFAGRMKDADDASRHAFLGDAPVCLADALFMELAQTQTPEGILAFAEKPALPEAPLFTRDSLLLDGIQDPGNLGTLLRTAAAAGMYQVLLTTDCVDAWSPKVLRAGQGAHFQIRIHEDVDLPAFLMDFQGDSLATTLEDAPSLYTSRWRHPVAWVFGSEGQGVRPQVLAAARKRLHIPMPGKVESLNVAAAAAICLFEMVRRHLDAG